MAVVAESSSASPNPSEDKPVIVRVKRKALQSPLDAFWLEINERPAKRPLLDFEKLSMSDSAGKGNEPLVDSAGMAEELKTKKVLVQHVETVSSFGTSVDVVKSFLDPNSGDVHDRKTKIGERKYALRKENKQDLILSKARQRKEVVAKNARFEQIWRSRRGNKETSHENLHEICHVYDVIRVDVAENPKDEISLEDQKILNSYLPLLREFIPSAASEIESDLYTNSSKQDSEDEYVYDLYAVKEESDMAVELSSNPFPFTGSKLMTRISMMGLMNPNMNLMIQMLKTTRSMIIRMRSLKRKKRNQRTKTPMMNQKRRRVPATNHQNPRFWKKMTFLKMIYMMKTMTAMTLITMLIQVMMVKTGIWSYR